MKANVQNWTIVATGSWNVAILNPAWVASNIFDQPEFEVDLIVDGVTPRFRYLLEKVVFAPSQNRLLIGARRPDDDCVKAAEDAMLKVFNLLPETPVGALGINFSYIEDQPGADVLAVFRSSDIGKFGDNDLRIVETNVSRSVAFEDRRLNFSVKQSENADVVFSLNYHVGNVGKASLAAPLLANKPLAYRAHSEKLIEELYGIHIDDGES